MPARDDFGSNAGRPGGYGGGAGGLANGGIGGGMGGGMGGGGAGRNGGINSRTGLTTGNRMYGGMAFGRPGAMAMNPEAWGIHPQPKVSQGPMNRPTRPSLLGNVPVPVSFEPPPAVPPDIPRTYVPSRIQQIFDPSPWMTPQAPDPLANDMTRLVRPGAAPLNPYGVSGGLGVPGYTTPRDPNYGFRNGYGGGYGTGGGYGGGGGGGW